ncbi:MAG: L-fucose/L-arabinose isomerase family protein [Bacteroidetes bacterium]|nr:L-fucose/L-arabinose isomerase family protein [Bacteroidota bacterium]HAY36343.1 fucose isomerase [Bacteroidota bacterium]
MDSRIKTHTRPITLGVIVGNRGFFPDHLCLKGRAQVLQVLEASGIRAVIVDEDATSNGAIESLQESRRCADLFKAHRDEIDGILVTLPNFGDERAIANTIRFSGLDVPVLVHAFQDATNEMSIANRRDSFCGKMSACNNLRQYGIRFSLTSEHTMDPTSEAFRADLEAFAAVCRVVGSIKGARFGQIGARPAAFNTVRFSEKLLERTGISVETLDLSELLGWIRKMTDSDAEVTAKLEEIQGYTRTEHIPKDRLILQAKLGAAIDRFVTDHELDATAIQCWTALQEFYGVVPCTCMSMMSNNLQASACEADIAGVLSMFALQQAALKPAALLDWNNNYGTDPDKGVVFHCSNLPKAFFADHEMDYQEIIASSVGKENTYGTMVGRIAAGDFTYARVTTDDLTGTIRSYVGEGKFTDDTLKTFGGYGVFHVNELQVLLRHICTQGFEHHVAATRARVSGVLEEAFSTYLDWDVYRHV